MSVVVHIVAGKVTCSVMFSFFWTTVVASLILVLYFSEFLVCVLYAFYCMMVIKVKIIKVDLDGYNEQW